MIKGQVFKEVVFQNCFRGWINKESNNYWLLVIKVYICCIEILIICIGKCESVMNGNIVMVICFSIFMQKMKDRDEKCKDNRYIVLEEERGCMGIIFVDKDV